MTTFQKVSLAGARMVMGWMFFYAGITKVVNADWSAAGYLTNAKTFAGFYDFLASPSMIGITNFVNEWALTLFGAALVLGIAVRMSSIVLAVMMFLYYLPILDFPYPNTHAYIVDEHIIYIFALLVLAAYKAGSVWGLGNKVGAWFARYPKIQNLIKG